MSAVWTVLRRRSVRVVLIAGLLALMILDTAFVSTNSQEATADTAVEYAEENYLTEVVPRIEESAVPLSELLGEIVADPENAGEAYGQRDDDQRPYSFATRATGTLVEGPFGEVGLEVAGIPSGLSVGIAIPPLGSATALRDAGADVTFGDFVNQTEYQNVAIELNKQAAEHVFQSMDIESMMGESVSVVGAFTWSSDTGGDVEHVTIVPVSIEDAS